MPITLPGNKRINQLAAVIAVGFAVAAVWQEFGSRVRIRGFSQRKSAD